MAKKGWGEIRDVVPEKPQFGSVECVTFCQLKKFTKWCHDGSHRAPQQSASVCVNSIAPNAIAIRLHILLPPPSSSVTQPHLHHHLLPGFAQACLWGLTPWPAPVEGHPAIFPSTPSPSSPPLPAPLPLAVAWGQLLWAALLPAGPLPLPRLVRHSPWGTLCFIVQNVAVGPYMNRYLSWLSGIWLPATLICWIFNHLALLYCVLFRLSWQSKSQSDVLLFATLWNWS